MLYNVCNCFLESAVSFIYAIRYFAFYVCYKRNFVMFCDVLSLPPLAYVGILKFIPSIHGLRFLHLILIVRGASKKFEDFLNNFYN